MYFLSYIISSLAAKTVLINYHILELQTFYKVSFFMSFESLVEFASNQQINRGTTGPEYFRRI